MRSNATVPQVQGNLQPKGVLVETFNHGSFVNVKPQLDAWYALPGTRQVININSYPVSNHAGITNWFTILHYVLYI